jgi:DNA-binding NtrC family response regulator
MEPKVLVVDDDPASRRLVAAIFAERGLTVLSAADGESGLECFRRDAPAVVILDLHLPDMDGMEVLERLRAQGADAPVVMLTAHVDVKSAVRAMRQGAFDYLTKPIDPEELGIVVERALEARSLKQEVEELRRRLGADGALATQMGPSPQVAVIMQQVETVARTDFSVLILGETGTGKELVAQAIHRQSKRRAGSFTAIDCGAIPEALLESELFGHERGAFTGADKRKEGRFHLAQGGSLFLDEVGNLPLGPQAKLLRVLESRQLQAVGATKAKAIDARFIGATNDDLQAKVTAGLFRPDLYFRLAQYTITLPPLRERPGDIAYLARRFLEEVSVELRRPVQKIASDAQSALERHRWPGNVRELRNVVRQAVLESRDVVLKRADLQRFLGIHAAAGSSLPPGAVGRSLKETADGAAKEAERQAICETLRLTRGNKSQAARALMTDYKTLHVKIKAFGIRARDFVP